MTLICGSLSWLEDHQRPVKKSIIQSDNNLIEPEWLKNIRQNSSEEHNIFSESTFKRIKKPKLISSLSMDNRIMNLVKLIDDPEPGAIDNTNDFRSRNFDQKVCKPTIIYCSRTHSQISQVMSELKKTAFFGKFSDSILNLAVATASRSTLCINNDLKKEAGSLSSLNESCNKLIQTEDECPFFNRKKDEAFKEHLNILSAKKIVDIEDILISGTSSQCCPYYSDRYLLQSASFVATPYNTILDKSTREAYGIDLEGNIIIFDEAHNIVDFVKQLNSLSISDPFNFFSQILTCIDEYIQKYSTRLRGSNMSSISQLRIFFLKVLEFIKSKNYNAFSVNDFIYKCQIDSFNFSRLLANLEETKLFTKVNNSIFLFL